MKSRSKRFVVLALLVVSMPTMAQKFDYTYNGTTIRYRITSVPNHEVAVNYVPEYVTEVTVPAVVYFNGEAFKVTRIGGGGSRGGGLFGSYEGDGYYSFEGCKLLKTVALPNTIKEIGSRAFADCTWFRKINLPSGLEIIESCAFLNCESLTSISLPSSIKKLEHGVFYNCKNLNVTSIKLPVSLKKIERSWSIFGGDMPVFYNCKGTLDIPATIDTLEYYVFDGCNFRLSEKFGFVHNDTIVIYTGNNVVEYSEFGKESYLNFGKKHINIYAFGSKYKVIGSDSFIEKVLSEPGYYLQASMHKFWASWVKKALIINGKFDEVLVFYPNDEEVKRLKNAADAKALVTEGDVLRDKRQYVEAKGKYEKALKLTPEDRLLQARIASINADIEEVERKHREAEEKARREAEERKVRQDVDYKIIWASDKLKLGKLQEAVELLQQAVDTTIAHKYPYRQSELISRRDSIIQVQAVLAGTSKMFDYKTYRRDLYDATNRALAFKIKSFMLERDKRVKANNVTFTLYTTNQEGGFQLGESSRTLKKFCKDMLKTQKLQPLVIDNQPLKAKATYRYSFEYAKGTVKVQQRGGSTIIDSKFEMSPQLESDLNQTFSSELRTLTSSCDGNYKYNVTAISVNDQTEYKVDLKSARFINGPQNAWRSLVVL